MRQATSNTTTRRQILAGAAGIGAAVAAGAGIAALTAPAGAMPELSRKWFACKERFSEIEQLGLSDAEADVLCSKTVYEQNDIENQLNDAVATTPADAIAHLEVARADMIQFKFGDMAFSEHGDMGDWLALSAIDNALRVLRSI